MANTYKNIVITPNIGSAIDDPKIVFSGGNATVNTDITLRTYPTSNGTLSFEGSAGQLFSITNELTGTIFSVNDVSGIPSIEVLDTGLVKLAQYGGNILVGTGTDNANDKLQIVGGLSVIGGLKANTANITGNLFSGNITISGASNGITFVDGTRQTTAYNSGVDATQNTQIGGIQGVDLTQNTRIQSIETINTNQNTSITALQTLANTDYTTLSIQATTSSSNGLYIPVVTVSANGRVTAISNTLITTTGGIIYTRKTTNSSINNSEGIIADTSAGSFTITLPSGPTVGNQVVIADGNNFSANNLTVARNGSTIEGIAEDLILDIQGVSVTFIYDGTTWEIYTQVGAQGGVNIPGFEQTFLLMGA